MKTFFTQPIGQLGRQNALGFIGLNVVLLVVGFGEIDLPVGLGNFINFLWGFSLLSLILAGYYLVEVIDNSYGTSCSSDSILLTEPNLINIYLTTDSTSAPWIYDGSILIDSITGGTSPYSFQWLDSVGIPFSSSSTSISLFLILDSRS